MEIRIRKASTHCLACGTKFEHLDKHFSCLNPPDDQELVREDYCQACWDSGRASDVEKTYSFWVSKYFDPSAVSEPDEAEFTPLRSIFYGAADKEERAEEAVAYLAAHLLRRQKVFRHVRAFEDTERDSAVTTFADRFSGRLVEVPDPGFSADELDEARRELVQRLERTEDERDDT